jgi:hypothetical protein
MKKLIQNKNRIYKSVNNHKIQIYHKLKANKHNVNGRLFDIYNQMSAIYLDLENDFQAVDLIDLEFYERWLNE